MTSETDEISDGYHTFGELYEHRAILFIALMRSHPELSWFADKHHDDSMFEGGWFIAGMNLPIGQISYHLRINPWYHQCLTSVRWLPRAPEWDGHTPVDVIERLMVWTEREND